MAQEMAATLTVILNHVRDIPALTGDMRPQPQAQVSEMPADSGSGGFGLSFDPAELVPLAAGIDGDALSSQK